MAIRHSPQFKEQVIQFSLSHPDQTQLHTAKQFGIGYSTLDKWLREHRLAHGGKARNDLSADQQRIRQLEREVAHLREVNDIIKKAHVYFVNHPSK
jgi:transposase-like protein